MYYRWDEVSFVTRDSKVEGRLLLKNEGSDLWTKAFHGNCKLVKLCHTVQNKPVAVLQLITFVFQWLFHLHGRIK